MGELAECEVQGELSTYHLLIIDILKILIIKIRQFKKSEESENKVYEYILTFIKSNPSADKPKVLFADDVELDDGIDDTEVDNLILKQLDINLDSFF